MDAIKNPNLHILLAEDDPDDSLLFSLAADVIEKECQVSLAEDGEMLLRFLEKNNKPAIIFMDLNMPKRNGRECLNMIRAKHDFDHIPVVIYSTSKNPVEMKFCFENGANYYIIKPNTFEGIIKVLKKVMGMNWQKPSSFDEFVLVT